MGLVRTKKLRNVSTDDSKIKKFWGKNCKKCQHWALTFFYRKKMRVPELLIRDPANLSTHTQHITLKCLLKAKFFLKFDFKSWSVCNCLCIYKSDRQGALCSKEFCRRHLLAPYWETKQTNKKRILIALNSVSLLFVIFNNVITVRSEM